MSLRRLPAYLRDIQEEVEGYARDLLLIDGKWRDHILTARVAPGDSSPPRG